MAGYRIERQMAEFGEHVRGWRMVLGLTAQQVAERAGIARTTLRKIEAGDPGVGFGSVAQVLGLSGCWTKWSRRSTRSPATSAGSALALSRRGARDDDTRSLLGQRRPCSAGRPCALHGGPPGRGFDDLRLRPRLSR